MTKRDIRAMTNHLVQAQKELSAAVYYMEKSRWPRIEIESVRRLSAAVRAECSYLVSRLESGDAGE